MLRARGRRSRRRRISTGIALQIFMGFLVTLAVVLALPIEAAQTRPYAGRPVADVLQQLQTPELRIIFSTDLVKPAMIVQAEPKKTDPKDIAREILEPHGLTVRPGPRGTLLVVAQPRKDPPVSRRQPPAEPTGKPQPPTEPQKRDEPLRIEEEVNVIDRLSETKDAPSTYTPPATVRETAGAFENVFLALQLMPGVVATNDEDGKMAVRGGGPEHNLILLDGVPIHNPLRLGDLGSPAFMNPATASNVTLDASGLDARYGGRLSSVTVLETRDGNRTRRFGLSGSVGLTTGDILAEGRLPGTASGSWWATARGTSYRAVLDRFGKDAVLPGFGDLQAKLTVQPTARTRLSVFTLAGRETLTNLGQDDAGNRVVVDEVKGINRLAMMTLTWNPARRLVTTTIPSIYWHDEHQAFNEQILGLDAFDRVMRVHDYALRQRALYAFSPRHVLDGGVELRRIDTGWRMKGVHDEWTRGLGPTTLGEQIDYSAGPIDTSLTRTQAGLWLQDRVPLGSRVTLDPGVRLDWNSFTGEAAWQPRIRATVRAAKATLWAGFATQVQTPSHESLQGRDYFYITPADGSRLSNERSQQFVVGLESPLAAGFDLRVEAYHRRFDHLLVQRLETAEEQALRLQQYVIPPDIPPDDVILERRPTIYPESTGTGSAKGIETLLQRRAGRATGWFSYTYSHSVRDLYGFTVPFDYDRPHALKAVGAYELSRHVRLSGTWQHASGLPATPMHAEVGFNRAVRVDGTVDPFYRAGRNRDGSLQLWPGFFMRRLGLRNSERLNAYSRTDLRLTYATLGHWEFYGELINVFNQRNYLQHFTLDVPGLLGGPFDYSQNVYPKFERLATFGIRASF
jgi:TonB dependent receptor-like, beta-barrel/TonB-dependent Receptor Plug Domain